MKHDYSHQFKMTEKIPNLIGTFKTLRPTTNPVN